MISAMEEINQSKAIMAGVSCLDWKVRGVLLEEMTFGAPGWLSRASNFGSDHDLTVREFKPHTGLAADSTEPTLDPLSPSFCPSPTCALPKINIKKEKKRKDPKAFKGH